MLSNPLPDGPALTGALALTLVLLTMVWLWSLAARDASLVDRFWGLCFVLAAWWYSLTGPGLGLPGALLLAAVTLWGVRLSAWIWWRNRGHGEDRRYAAMRIRRGPSFAWISLCTVFWLQGILAWVIGMPLFAGLRSTAPASIPVLGLGLVCWIVGFLFEAGGDWQLARHRSDPARRGTVLDTGLWRWTRHPNYFGDALLWWGIWLMASSLGGWWTAFAPLLMTWLLVRVSGVALLEQDLTSSKPGYRDYVARTSAFIPWPPRPAPRTPPPGPPPAPPAEARIGR